MSLISLTLSPGRLFNGRGREAVATACGNELLLPGEIGVSCNPGRIVTGGH